MRRHIWRSLGETETFLRQLERQDFLPNLKRPPPMVPDFCFNTPRWKEDRRRYEGSYVRRYGGGSVQAETPVGGAVVVIGQIHSLTGAASLNARDGDRYQEADLWPYMPMRSALTGTFWTLADSRDDLYMSAALVETRGQITHMSQFHLTGEASGEAGLNGNWDDVGRFRGERDNILCLFEATPVPLMGLRAMEPKDFIQLLVFLNVPRAVEMLRGEDNVPFQRVNVSGERGAAAVWLGRPRRFKLLTRVPLLLDNSPGDEAGIGYRLPKYAVDVLSLGAADLWSSMKAAWAALKSTASSSIRSAACTTRPSATSVRLSSWMSSTTWRPRRRIAWRRSSFPT